MKKDFTYYIDIVSYCNLRCPSCPNGTVSIEHRKKELMNIELFKKILKKIKTETGDRNVKIDLYNWGEPTLHPDLALFVKIGRGLGFPVFVSSNYSSNFNLKKLIRSKPSQIRVSISGNTQEIYEITHTGGNIELVKKKLQRTRELLDELKIRIPIQIIYHKYKNNLGSEIHAVEKMVTKLGFNFVVDEAYANCVEKIYDFCQGNILPSEKVFLQLLRYDLNEVLDKAQKISKNNDDCNFKSNQMAINADGSVSLCCTVYLKENIIAPSYLDFSFDTLQEFKSTHPMCLKCISSGINNYYRMRNKLV